MTSITKSKVMVLFGLGTFVLGFWIILLPGKLNIGGVIMLLGITLFYLYMKKLQ